MEEELSLDNILGAEEIDNLFTDADTEETQEEDSTQDDDPKQGTDNNTQDKVTTEVNADELFADKPESVGSGDDNIKEQEDTTPKGDGTSPKNFYSSIAKALKEEGIFPDLEDDSFSNIKDPEDFRDLIENQIKAGLDERQRRIDEALNVGVEPDEIKRYENTLQFLESINDDALKDESQKGEDLRKNLIFQDFINRGYSKERATREVKKSLDSGSDIEDANEALKSNKEFFKDKYNELINDAKAESQHEEEQRKQQAEKLRTSILEDKKVFGDLVIDKPTRQKIYNNIAKPVYKDPDTGDYYTALQKYEMENRTDFLKNIGILFTLTDGFKNLDNLVKGKVRKEVKKGLRELENTINNTSITSDGNLRYVSGVNEDPESFIGKGWKLDV